MVKEGARGNICLADGPCGEDKGQAGLFLICSPKRKYEEKRRNKETRLPAGSEGHRKWQSSSLMSLMYQQDGCSREPTPYLGTTKPTCESPSHQASQHFGFPPLEPTRKQWLLLLSETDLVPFGWAITTTILQSVV